jgi:iron complex outermembrane recepter protein
MRNQSLKLYIAALVSSSSLMCGAALAQGTGDTPSENADSSPNEIIVTATRREARVQDIAATVEVLGGDDLRASGIANAAQIEFAVPGLQFGNAGFDGALLGLRGVSSQRGFTGDEAAVAVHIDGVFQPQSAQALARLFDVERVEVLKGPQGTLYGRNANAGVINVVTKAPDDELGGYAQLSYGSFKTIRGEGAINLPLAENQGLRIAVAGADGDGYIKNILDDRTFANNKFLAGRLRYHGEFNSATVNVSGQYVSDRSQNDAAFTPRAVRRLCVPTGRQDSTIPLSTYQRGSAAKMAISLSISMSTWAVWV